VAFRFRGLPTHIILCFLGHMVAKDYLPRDPLDPFLDVAAERGADSHYS
jgi:hypothetical protein